MKLKTFNRQNLAGGKTEIPMISFGKSGVVSFNIAAIQAHSFVVGERLEFVQDEDRPADWYIRRTSSDLGFKLREDKAKFLAFNSSGAIRKIQQSVGFEGSKRCLLGAEWQEIEGELYLPIITKSAK